ncbi:MAG: hypothetical protein MJ200_04685 [Mycoplasmoidaceae bacterium]|nr:hypothetical protein [Mycoplasmoidaceae bacterium]
MKIIKLLTPIFTLATTTSVVMPLVACNKDEHKDPVDPTKIVDVKVVNTDEYVKLDKEQAEKGKRFEAHVNYVCSFALDSIIVKNGEKALTPDEDFTFSYITHLLVIKEGVITDTISIQLEFSYVTVDIAKYRTYGHGENMISADAINVTNSEREFTLYMNLDYSN